MTDNINKSFEESAFDTVTDYLTNKGIEYDINKGVDGNSVWIMYVRVADRAFYVMLVLDSGQYYFVINRSGHATAAYVYLSDPEFYTSLDKAFELA